MSDYLDSLIRAAHSSGNILCLGLDPDPARIAAVEGGPPLQACRRFLDGILESLIQAGLKPAALKPNLAYFEQFGSAGLAWLEELLPKYRGLCPIILDAKRGDIGPSSSAYARAIFEHWGAHAVTVSPWMGLDSIEPFLRYERGVYVLVRTSNPGSAELQMVLSGSGTPMWQVLLDRMLSDWYRPGLGAVGGATQPQALERLAQIVGDKPFPLLIPGVGSQGGEAEQVMARLPGERGLHRVNVSSSILYAFEKSGSDYRQAAVAAFRQYAEQLTCTT